MSYKNTKLVGSIAVIVLCFGSIATVADRPTNRELLLDIQSSLAELQSEVKILKNRSRIVRNNTNELLRNDVTCTIRARRAGECDQVVEATASVCFETSLLNLAAEAAFEIKAVTKGEGGAGWTLAPDGKATIDLRVPNTAIPGLPSLISLGWEPSLGTGSSICMEMPIDLLGDLRPAGRAGSNSRTPILLASIANPPMLGGQAMPVALEAGELDMLADRFEEVAETMLPRMLDTVVEKMPSGERLGRAVDAAESLRNGELTVLEGELLTDPLVMDILDVLPVFEPAKDILRNPGLLAQRLPDLTDGIAVCDHVARSEFIGVRMTNMCDFIDTLPKFDKVAGTIEGLPEAITAAVAELIDPAASAQKVSDKTKNKFCSGDFFKGYKFCN